MNVSISLNVLSAWITTRIRSWPFGTMGKGMACATYPFELRYSASFSDWLVSRGNIGETRGSLLLSAAHMARTDSGMPFKASRSLVAKYWLHS